MTFPGDSRLLSTACCLLLVCALLVAGAASSAATRATEAQIDEAVARLDSLRAARRSDLVHSTAALLIARARAEADSAFLLPVLIRDGIEWASYGHATEGEPVMREALSLAEALEDSLHMCLCLRWLGYCVNELGHRDESLEIHARQLTIARAIGDRRNEGWALVGQAWATHQEGDPRGAARLYRQAVEAFTHCDCSAGEMWARNGLGIVASVLGEYHEAARSYEWTARLAHEQGSLIGEAFALNNLGTMYYNLGDPSRAMVAFERAYEIQLEIGNLRESLIPGGNIVFCQTLLGRYQEAVARISDMLAECREMNSPAYEAELLNQLGGMRKVQGLYHEAIANYRAALAIGESATFHARLESMIGLSDSYAGLDDPAQALAVLLEAAAEFEDRVEGELAVMWHLNLGQRYDGVDRQHEALEHLRLADRIAVRTSLHDYRVDILAEMARAHRILQAPDSTRICLDQAAVVWEAERAISGDPEWREQRGATGRLLYTALAENLLDYPVDRPAPDRVREAFDRLQIFKARTLLERMSSPEGKPALADSTGQAITITLVDLQDRVLRPGEVFLDTYVGPDVSICFAVTREEAKAVRWAADENLVSRLQYYHELLSTPPDVVAPDHGAAGRRRAGQVLAAEFFGELGPMLKRAARIIVAPDGPLNLIPLKGLPGGEDFMWTRVPSAEILARLRSGVAASPATSVLSPRTARMLAVAGNYAGDVRGRMPALAGAEEEVRSLGRRFRDVDVKILPDASHPLGWDDLVHYDALHIASHVRVDDQYPWHSALLLTPEPEAGAGRLTAARIAGLQVSADLVVLASCESGAGRIVSGEGVLGIASAFLSAGASTVVATLWPVADQATGLLMERFYRELAAGRSVSAALAGAQQALRENPATAHPFFWSGFVVIGDGEIRVDLIEKRSPLSTASVFSTAAILTAILLLLSLAARRRRPPID